LPKSIAIQKELWLKDIVAKFLEYIQRMFISINWDSKKPSGLSAKFVPPRGEWRKFVIFDKLKFLLKKHLSTDQCPDQEWPGTYLLSCNLKSKNHRFPKPYRLLLSDELELK